MEAVVETKEVVIHWHQCGNLHIGVRINFGPKGDNDKHFIIALDLNHPPLGGQGTTAQALEEWNQRCEDFVRAEVSVLLTSAAGVILSNYMLHFREVDNEVFSDFEKTVVLTDPFFVQKGEELYTAFKDGKHLFPVFEVSNKEAVKPPPPLSDWKFEMIRDGVIEITDPQGVAPLVIEMDNRLDSRFRVVYRLVQAIMTERAKQATSTNN